MATSTSTPPPSNPSPLPSSNGASWHSVWAQRLPWLISALSGTLEIEADIKRIEQENAKLDEMILQRRNEKSQIRNDTEQIRNDTERIKNDTERIKNDTERIKNEAEQIKNEAEQIRKDNERLAELESKIDSSFRKYGINLPLAQIPDQP